MIGGRIDEFSGGIAGAADREAHRLERQRAARRPLAAGLGQDRSQSAGRDLALASTGADRAAAGAAARRAAAGAGAAGIRLAEPAAASAGAALRPRAGACQA